MVTCQAHFRTSPALSCFSYSVSTGNGERQAFLILKALRGSCLKIVLVFGMRKSLSLAFFPSSSVCLCVCRGWGVTPSFSDGCVFQDRQILTMHFICGYSIHMAHFIFLQHRSAARHQYWSYSKHNETFVFLECLANRSASG